MATPLQMVIKRLEDEARALVRSPQVLSQSPENIKKYLELIAFEGPISANGPKKRTQEILRIVKKYSTEFFVLCALATTQKILGSVKWTRNEVMELCEWWDSLEKPIDILQEFWKEATQESNESNEIVAIPESLSPFPQGKRQTILVTGLWIRDALSGKDDTKFQLSWGDSQPPSIELDNETQQALAIKATMRAIVQD